MLAESYLRSGKVRDLYRAPGGDALLLIASDRISAFDVVLPTEVPDKGRVLTGLSQVLVRPDRHRSSRTTCSGARPDDPPRSAAASCGAAPRT